VVLRVIHRRNAQYGCRCINNPLILIGDTQGLIPPDERTIRCWLFDATRKHKSGNKAQRTVSGSILSHMLLGRLLYPKCTLDELRAWIFENDPSCIHILRAVEISRAETRRGITRKKGATDAFQAFTTANLQKRHLFWTCPYPLGVFGHPRATLVDFDECGLYMKKVNRPYGKTTHGA
jgi:hypothetical protein